jgi:hypothetical protein
MPPRRRRPNGQQGDERQMPQMPQWSQMPQMPQWSQMPQMLQIPETQMQMPQLSQVEVADEVVRRYGEEDDWEVAQIPTEMTEDDINDVVERDRNHRHHDMPIGVCSASQKQRESYYTDMLPNWEKETVMDYISGETLLLPDFIKQDSDNIVFIMFNADNTVRTTFPSERNRVEQTMPVYECAHKNSLDRIFIPINLFGAPYGGVCSYDITKRIVVDTNYQIFFLRDQAKEGCFTILSPQSAPLMSHAVQMGISGVSDVHCQDGSERTIYQIHVPSFYY